MAERNANTLRRRQGESNLLFAALPDQLKKDGALQGQTAAPGNRKWSSCAGIGRSRYRSSESAFQAVR